MPLDNRTCFRVNLRDALSCKGCGKAPASRENYHRGFQYHHLIHKCAGGTDDASNIVLLCHDCHLAHHRDGRELAADKWDLSVPRSFPCHNCAARLCPEDVEMNCGWYLCLVCDCRTHLFEHFDLGGTS